MDVERLGRIVECRYEAMQERVQGSPKKDAREASRPFEPVSQYFPPVGDVARLVGAVEGADLNCDRADALGMQSHIAVESIRYLLAQ